MVARPVLFSLSGLGGNNLNIKLQGLAGHRVVAVKRGFVVGDIGHPKRQRVFADLGAELVADFEFLG